MAMDRLSLSEHLRVLELLKPENHEASTSPEDQLLIFRFLEIFYDAYRVQLEAKGFAPSLLESTLLTMQRERGRLERQLGIPEDLPE